MWAMQASASMLGLLLAHTLYVNVVQQNMEKYVLLPPYSSNPLFSILPSILFPIHSFHYLFYSLSLSSSIHYLFHLFFFIFLFYILFFELIFHFVRSKNYYYGYIGSFWIVTLGLPCFCFFETTHQIRSGFCQLSSILSTCLRTGFWFLFLVIQIFMLLRVFGVVCTILSAVECNTSSKLRKSNTLFWLFLRCVGAQANQILVWAPTTVKELTVLWGGQPGTALNFICAVTPAFLSLNGFIVMAGNEPLRTLIASPFIKILSKGPIENSPRLLESVTSVSFRKITQ
eukprot:Phypoly_transcript_08578.p1 GENE.Phypoly_transcript_08578~~Phypoly_transcript_08578.p1  ORF type:complete len:286 (+),score=3.24 Phypoly_transcript_08578:632-1489(+)